MGCSNPKSDARCTMGATVRRAVPVYASSLIKVTRCPPGALGAITHVTGQDKVAKAGKANEINALQAAAGTQDPRRALQLLALRPG